MKQAIFFLVLILFVSGQVFAQGDQPQQSRAIKIKLKTGETLTGDLVKVDLSSVDFKVKGILQTVPLDDVESINFHSEVNAAVTVPINSVHPMNKAARPTIIYKEKASYTKEARDQGVEGIVVLNVVFTGDGKVTNIRVVRGLPHGLTENAISAAQKIKFNPALKDGKPVSIRGNLEYTFKLDGLSAPVLDAPVLISPGNQQVFDHYPRKTELKWKAVPSAVRYKVLIEIGDQEGKNWTRFQELEVAETEYTFYFPGAQPGRWRVTAIPPSGIDGYFSSWRYFKFTK